jgi:hypothetical protein
MVQDARVAREMALGGPSYYSWSATCYDDRALALGIEGEGIAAHEIDWQISGCESALTFGSGLAELRDYAGTTWK